MQPTARNCPADPQPWKFLLVTVLAMLMAGCGDDEEDIVIDDPDLGPIIFPSQSGTIQIHPLDSIVYSLNSHEGTMTALGVLNSTGQEISTVLAEIPTGNDPSSISIHPSGSTAYVSNAADGTVTVINLGAGAGPFSITEVIAVGSEPRGTALTPSGGVLYVANFGDGSLTLIDTATNTVLNTAPWPIRNPYAIAITNDQDGDDSDETVFVSDFFGRARPGLPLDSVEGFDDGKEGRIAALSLATGLTTTIALSPMPTGFNANRTLFCTTSTPPAVNDTYCEGQAVLGVGDGGASVPTDAFFNQLFSLVIDQSRGRLYVPAIGASPEPPVNFSTNFQALVGVIDTATGTEVTGERVNLNEDVAQENGGVAPTAPFGDALLRTFMGDLTSMAIRGNTVIAVSRAGSFAARGTFDATGVLTLNPPNVVRYPVGSIPSGVVINSTGTRAYVVGEISGTLTVINLTSNTVLSNTVVASLPTPGSQEHNVRLGALAFFTGMGVPPTGLTGMDVRGINTHQFRGMASRDNWSSCASCHPFGLADGVTWIFDGGPRQSIPLDGSFNPLNASDQRVFNWSAVRGSFTDFNNNSRGVQGGIGFTAGGSADAGTIFNHGPNVGAAEALDLMTLWGQQAIRVFNRPSNTGGIAFNAGRTAFGVHCADCHGGGKWSTPRVRWSYPLFALDPVANSPQAPFDPRVINLGGAATVLSAYDESPAIDGSIVAPIISQIGTRDPANPIEIRGAGGLIAQASAGAAASFNPPSLLGVAHSGPYGHHGRAQTLADVFRDIPSGGLGHPTTATPAELTNILEFIRGIDGVEPPF